MGLELESDQEALDFADDDREKTDQEQSDILQRLIEELKIPFVRTSIFIYLVCSLLLVVVPVLLFNFVINDFETQLMIPIQLINSVGDLRYFSSMISAYITRIAAAELLPIDDQGNAIGAAPAIDRVESYLDDVRRSLRNTAPLRNYRPGSAPMEGCRDDLYTATLEYLTS
jgi:hypothetical protein